MDLKQLHQLKCELLKVYRYQGLTLQELLCEFYSHINEVINSTNGLIDIVDYLVGDGLSKEVATHLNNMLIDGTFEKIITKKVNELSTNLNSQFNEMKSIIESNISESDKLIENLRVYDSRFNNIDTKNIEQDSRLKDVENKNKVQDVYLSGLFNENKDGRLSIEGEGNDLKLEGSKQGLVEIDKVVGNTLVNLYNKTIPTGQNGSLSSNGNIYRVTRLNGSASPYLQFKLNENISLIKPSTYYTVKINNYKTSCGTLGTIRLYDRNNNIDIADNIPTIDLSGKVIFCTKSSIDTSNIQILLYVPSSEVNSWVECSNEIILLEGDYTNKPIPTQHIEGLQSSFEENLVTQEMINEGLESEENLGKYKVPVKVVGKNKFDGELENGGINKDGVLIDTNCTRSKNFIKVKPNTNYIFTPPTDYTGNIYLHEYNNEFELCELEKVSTSSKRSFVTGSNTVNLKFNSYNPGVGDRPSLIGTQLEEGTVATDYEEYFERTTNVYLNSPLLEGGEIVMKDGELCHYHEYSKEIFDGSDDEGWDSTIKTNTNNIKYADNLSILSLGIDNRVIYCDKLLVVKGNQNKLTSVGQIVANSSSVYSNRFYISTDKNTIDEFKQSLKENPITLVYQLAEPYYEPISSDKLLLECANDSTLSVDTVVPVEIIKASYTGNVPSVYAIEETCITNTEDITVTQTAVDFLLMSSKGESLMISFLNNVKGINNLGTYFASRIIKKALSYEDVINKYPQFKNDIDTILVNEGYEYLIK